MREDGSFGNKKYIRGQATGRAGRADVICGEGTEAEMRDDEIIEKGDLRHHLLETWRYRDMNREKCPPSTLVVGAERGADSRRVGRSFLNGFRMADEQLPHTPTGQFSSGSDVELGAPEIISYPLHGVALVGPFYKV